MTPAKKYTFYMILFVMLGLILRLLIIWQPADRIVQFNGDDMYYYLKIAENIVEGNGISFDGLHATNGFHPLYLIILIPIMIIFLPDKLLAAHVSLTLLAILNVITALFIYKIIHLLTKNRNASLMGAFIWIFNPWTIFIAATGVEVAISTFFISIAFYYYLKIRDKISIANMIVLGLWCALSFLSRSDSIFVFIAIILDMLFRFYRKNKDISSIFTYKYFYIFGVSFLLFISPWLVWSKINFGIFIQGSAIALKYNSAPLSFWQLIYSSAFSLAYNIFKFFNYFVTTPLLFLILGIMSGHIMAGRRRHHVNKTMRKTTFYFLTPLIMTILLLSVFIKEPTHYLQGLSNAIILLALGAALGILGFIIGFKFKIMVFDRNSLRNNIFLLLFLIIIFLFYAVYFRRHQPWYYLSILLAVTILFSVALSRIINQMKPKKYTTNKIYITIFLVLIVLFSIRGIILYNNAATPWSKDMYSAAIYLKDNYPADARIGSLNSGIYGYFSERTIINLDGVVNNHLMNEKFNGISTIEYIHDQNITYIVEYPCFIHDLDAYLIIDKQIPPEIDPFCENSGPVIYKVKGLQ